MNAAPVQEAGQTTAAKAVNATKNAAQKALNFMKNVSTQNVQSPENPLFWVLIVAIVFLFIFCIQLIMNARSNVSNSGNINAISEEKVAALQAKFSIQYKDRKTLLEAVNQEAITEEENCLINLQPLTVIQPGFLGPVKNGVYNEREGVTAALRMGARCLVIPIDFFDKDTMAKPFPDANTPCMLFRDAAGTIRSLNAGDLGKVFQTIADVAWSDLVFQKNDPLILVLYFVNTPPEGTKEYLNFLSKVAVSLSPLTPYLLTQTPEGVYNRQGKQDELLFVNTNQLEKKLLIFCNVDTSGFRTATRDFKRTYTPKEDLDYWVHLRIYKNNADTPMGMTGVPGKTEKARAIIDRTNYYVTMPTDTQTKKTATDATKEAFMITTSPEGQNPSKEVATLVLNSYGVQSVPLYLTDYTADFTSVLGMWPLAWKAKPKAIRYVRAPPIQVAQQSAAANANGGQVTSPM
jgi:hypothetical protein